MRSLPFHNTYKSELAADWHEFGFITKWRVKWDLENCLIRSGFEDKLNRLEKGIHTNIYINFESDGFELSSGEGQKIALARSLYKNTPIVILDEPTAPTLTRAWNMKFISISMNASRAKPPYISKRQKYQDIDKKSNLKNRLDFKLKN